MRLWTIHPKYLDRQGLLALWREGLLAQKVLQNKTKGYKNHSQLIRFKSTNSPLEAISKYLETIQEEATKRGYTFDKSKILKTRFEQKIEETNGQLEYEWKWFLNKIKSRSPEIYKKINKIKNPDHHPIFKIIKGEVRNWENKKI